MQGSDPMPSDIQKRDDPVEDDTWIEEAREASPPVLSRIVESLRPYVTKVADRALDRDLRTEASVSDLVQETLYDAQRDFEKFRGSSEQEFKAWLVGIFRKKLKDFRRRLLRPGRDVRRETPLTPDAPLARSDLTSPSGQAIRRERQQLVRAARARLPERARNIVAWYVDEGCTFAEIGRRLGCSGVNARKLWLRAVKQLARELSALRDESNAWNRSENPTAAPDTNGSETSRIAEE
jgi:RNA polymerase sigma-70 factor, ECF subfamily